MNVLKFYISTIVLFLVGAYVLTVWNHKIGDYLLIMGLLDFYITYKILFISKETK